MGLVQFHFGKGEPHPAAYAQKCSGLYFSGHQFIKTEKEKGGREKGAAGLDGP